MLLRLSERTVRYTVAILICLASANCSQTDPVYDRIRSDTGLLEWEGVHQLIRGDFPTVPTVTTDQLAEALMAGQPVILLDTRDASEFLVSHLPEARLVRSTSDLIASLKDVSPDTLIVAYCSVGYRSAKLIQELQQRGITTAFNLEGSIFAWANAGLPIYRENSQVRQVHPFNESWGQLLKPELWAFAPTEEQSLNNPHHTSMDSHQPSR